MVRSLQLDSWIGPHEIRLLADGTEIEFVGGIGGAANAELAKMLDENPRVRAIQLTSQGGDALLAMDMELLVRARKLVTYVPRLCVSACAFVFLGGTERYVAPNAQLGFHAAVALDDSPAEIARLGAAVNTWMLGRGIAPAFVDRAVSTPHTTMWVPTPDELLRAHVTTGPASPANFAAPSFGAGLPGLVRQGLPQNDPLYAASRKLIFAIRKADPASYDAMEAKLYEALRAGAYDPARTASVTRLLDQAVKHAMSIAGDDAVTSLVSSLTDQSDRLAIIDPAVCLRPTSVPPAQLAAAMAALPLELRIREVTAMAMVVESSMSSPQPPPPLDEARAIYRVLLRNLANVFGDDTKYLVHPDLDPARTCGLRNAILKAVLNLGSHDRSVLLRSLMLGQLS